MTEKVTILLFGATGYIGGSILNRLLTHPKASYFNIIAPVRSAAKAKLLDGFGVKAVVASLSDHDKIESLASCAHIILNAATTDDLPALIAILKGTRQAYESTGRIPTFIHTSGAADLTEPAQGECAATAVHSDVDIPQLKSVPPTALHRKANCVLIGADEQGYVRTHIMSLGIVYGIAHGPVFDSGIAKPFSIHVPALIKCSLDRRRSAMLGPGKAVWPVIHIDDVTDEYLVLLDAVLENHGRAGHGWEGCYLGENGHVSFYEIGRAIGEALVEMGLVDDAEPTQVTDAELVKYWGSAVGDSRYL
ncbi:NAD-binding protein [Fomitopsis schrenkii]|uniref:NAD-binding protein n=1 Tax=Fomitopsis schrenkii TaxID=2126942 RepID=S8DM76_FOMSC|nr:NAD-binding protein [Fomitopsis schrenkii]